MIAFVQPIVFLNLQIHSKIGQGKEIFSVHFLKTYSV